MVTADPKLYSIDFKRPVFQSHYGIRCKLPTPPPDRECENYGMPAEKQKFRRTHIPADLWDWQFMGEAKKTAMEQFIADEHHKRRHGIWIFIKGVKFYVPGVMYYFFNYWTMETGSKPTFKICDLHFFLVWFHVCNDPNCYGLVDFKPRRIGDTEKALCIVYEFATRVRNTHCGMQSNTGDDIKEKFTERLVYGHDQMIWFMKPINRGSTNPQEGLIFEYPVAFNTGKAIEARIKAGETLTTSSEAKYLHPPLKSKISHKPSVPKAYNGKKLGRYYCDEFGMMEEMDPNEAWALVKMAQKDKNTDLIVGKALFTANVDEVGKDKAGAEFSRLSMDYAYQLWEESNLEELDENGETTNGLYRILRTWKDNCPVDEWGFPMIEKVAVKRKHTIDSLIKKRKIKALYQYRRQNPETWDDVFLSTGETSGMDVERLLARLQWLNRKVDEGGKKVKPRWLRGDLDWKDGIFNWQDPTWIPEVVFRPNSEGDFWFAHNGLPSNHGVEANARVAHAIRKPGNIDVFCMATDPYEEKDAAEKRRSQGGLAVRRLYDHEVDGHKVCKTEADLLDNQEIGDPLNYGADWETDKYMMFYMKREEDPNKFYEMGLRAAVFYGTDNLIEANKGGSMKSKWEQWEFGGYLQDRPEYSKPASAEGRNTVGIYATDGSKELYFKLLKTESVKKANTIDIPIICEQISTLNWKNATKKDGAVGCGWSHVAALRNVKKRNRDKKSEARKNKQLYRENSI